MPPDTDQPPRQPTNPTAPARTTRHKAGPSKAAAKIIRRVLSRASRPHDLRRLRDPHQPLRVLLGAGRHQQPGWLATDQLPRTRKTVYLDLAKRFPFADGSVQRIQAEHVIEHLTLAVAAAMLDEAHRVLTPGGRIRIATPDLTRIVALCDQPLTNPARRYTEESNELFLSADSWVLHEPLVALNRMFRDHGHQYIYDAEFLTSMLNRHGFIQVTRHEVGESQDPAFQNLERHAEQIGEFCNAYETLVVEATRAP